jgi:nicotinamide mononucleotide transporter
MLQVFYVAMAIVGWLSWRNSSPENATIKIWGIHKHVLNIVISGVVSLILGFIFDTYTNQENPYVDAFTTCYSLSATFMVAKKIIGNWIYWIVIDLVSIYLYAQRGYNLAAVQYGIFTILAIVGFVAWRNEYKHQQGR